MTLQQIRDTKTAEGIWEGTRFLCENMQVMTYGEFLAYRRTLEEQARKLGVSITQLNNYAVMYQQEVMGIA